MITYYHTFSVFNIIIILLFMSLRVMRWEWGIYKNLAHDNEEYDANPKKNK